MPAQTVIKIRRDTSTNWASVDPTLGAGEIAFETDTNKIKVGDGSTAWSSLDYASGAGTAAEITYDNTDAELIAVTVKAALDELSLSKANSSELSTNLNIYPTTVASDISGYNKLVDSIYDVDFDDPAVAVPTGAINADGQLIASLASAAGLFEGSLDPINVTIVGGIRKTAGNSSKSASFYFEIYKRADNGTETLVGLSDSTGEVNPANGDYHQFSATAFTSFNTMLSTDRIVTKFYGNVEDGVGAEYDFRFGGIAPARILIPVPASVIVVHEASGVILDTSTFDGILSGSDDTVQAALETIDDFEVPPGTTASDTAPSSPETGQLWWDSSDGTLYIYYDSYWVQSVTGITGPRGSDNIITAATAPSDLDVLWIDTSEDGDAVLPLAGTTGQVLSKVDGADYNTEWTTLPTPDLSAIYTTTFITDATTARTLVATDSGKTIRFTSGSATVVTVDASTDFTVGTRVDIIADGAGELTVAASTATIAGAATSTTSGSFTIGEQYSSATLLCVATDEYRLIGNVAVV